MFKFDGQGPPKALVVLCVVALLALGCQASFATVVDLTTELAEGSIGGVQFHQALGHVPSSGSGVWQSFVRISTNDPIEEGYNTDYRPLQYDENNSPTFTKSIILQDVPIVQIGGTGPWYFEFRLDINQNLSGTDAYLALDQVELYVSSVGDAHNHPSGLGTLKYSMDNGGDNWVALKAGLSTGSGSADMVMLVPVSTFSAAEYPKYVYLYSKFGESHTLAAAGAGGATVTTWANNDGFEEWAHLQGGTTIPEPSSMLLMGLALGSGAFAKFRRRKRAV